MHVMSGRQRVDTQGVVPDEGSQILFLLPGTGQCETQTISVRNYPYVSILCLPTVVTHTTRSPRPPPSMFAHCKRVQVASLTSLTQLLPPRLPT